MAKRLILYLEDNPDDVRIMELSLARLMVNYALQTVVGRREAIDRVKNGGRFADRDDYPVPQIIFLNVTLSETDGFDVLKVVKGTAVTRDVPIFALTGSMDPGLEKKATDLGAIGFIEKGWSNATFAKILDYINSRLTAASKSDLLLGYQSPAST